MHILYQDETENSSNHLLYKIETVIKAKSGIISLTQENIFTMQKSHENSKWAVPMLTQILHVSKRYKFHIAVVYITINKIDMCLKMYI